ncbi:MAG: YlxR family protein [Miltoncostaeaceae bacterium]
MTTAPTRRGRHVPIRRCLGCGHRRPRAELVRFVAVPDGGLARLRRDSDGTAPGRGLYTCPDQGCFDRAVDRRAFARAARLGDALDTSDIRAMGEPDREGE